MVLSKSLSRRERVARDSGPGEGYRSEISVPLIRPFGPPSPFRRRIHRQLIFTLRNYPN
jgi:hypothetical protein